MTSRRRRAGRARGFSTSAGEGGAKGGPHVLVVSTGLDSSTDEVVIRLVAKGARVTRLNTETFPFHTALTAQLDSSAASALETWVGTNSTRDATSLWYRRVRSPEKPAAMMPGVHDFCLRESRAALIGALLALPHRVMSPPERVWAAEHKLMQLAVAKAVGLQVPTTIVTNDAVQVRTAFRRFRGQMIIKPVRTGYVDYGEEQHAVYTSQVLEEHLAELADVELSPAIYQPLIPKRSDVRATFVGERVFVAEIDSQSDPSASVDWRRTDNPALPHRRTELPRAVEEGAREVMRRLGLSFGAFDFVRTPNDEWIFLEVNPNGQWLWLDDILALGITDAVTDWLLGVEGR